MACCYIAASMIAFIIKSCELLDVDLKIQYNESVKHGLEAGSRDECEAIEENGITMISVSGMTCAACVTNVEKALADIKGVDQAMVSLPLQEARVFHLESVNRHSLIEAIESAGYGATLGERSNSQKIETLRQTSELANLRTSLRGLGFLSTLIFGLGIGFDWLGLDRFMPANSLFPFGRSVLLLGLTIMAAAQYGNWIFRYAWIAARQPRLSMHILITASTVVGIGLTAVSVFQGRQGSQYFDSIVGVLLIVTVGRYMDLLSRRRTTSTFEGLYTLLDETSSVKLFKLKKRVPTAILRPGDEIVVESYSIVPCDCYVLEGSSYVNEAIITGESHPKPKNVGALLLAGSRNGPNELKAAVHQDYQRSFLSQLVKSVEVSLTAKPSTQQWIDVVTHHFVGIIFAIAAVTSTAAFVTARPEGLGHAVDAAGRRMMTILAAACPCALGLATPCAMMAGIDVAWRNGILMLGGGETMEAAKNISHVLMDKTGTLTRGTPVVSSMAISPVWRGRERELAALICAAEEKGMASHPLGMAIFQHLLPACGNMWHTYQKSGTIYDLDEVGGRGVGATISIDGEELADVHIGNMKFMHDNNVEVDTSVCGQCSQDGSIVFVAIDNSFAASLTLQDTVRPDARSVLDSMKSLGLRISMLTGDVEAEAKRISNDLGIEVTAASATPDVKLNEVSKLQDAGQKVMMVGDGMNDGPSLATAAVGVMLAHGRKCLSSGGSVLILQSQLKALLIMLDISKSTMRQVSINIAWALAYNIVAIALAVGVGEPFGISIGPPVAAAMMSVSSTFITIQGLLLRARLAARHSSES